MYRYSSVCMWIYTCVGEWEADRHIDRKRENIIWPQGNNSDEYIEWMTAWTMKVASWREKNTKRLN